MDADIEVSVKDIVNFYIKINDASKAKRDFAQFSSKDKATALDLVEASSGTRDFKVEVAKYFVYDLDQRVRRKSELMLEALVPGWVSDPAESILKLLKSAESKGAAQRDAAVKFLFGIVDANSLRDTFLTLLNSRNRAHMLEIIAILEDYIDSSMDEREQVKIFDACLDIVLSDDAEQNIKFHASNLLSVFFKKVAATQLGETLRLKYIERQIDKAEGVYRYLCSGAAGLTGSFLEDLLRPLVDGGKVYQLKMIGYFRYVLEKAANPDEVDSVLDTYPDYWNQHEPTKEEKVRHICRRIRQALEELWERCQDPEVREQIIRLKFAEYADKRELLDQIRNRIENEACGDGAREKIALMLRCFLQPSEHDALKMQAAQLLLSLGYDSERTAALEYLMNRVEHGALNSAEKGAVVTMMETLLKEEGKLDAEIAGKGRYVLFVAAPERFTGEEAQAEILRYLQDIAEGGGFGSDAAEERVLQALVVLSPLLATERVRKEALYLEFSVRNPRTGIGRNRLPIQS